MGIKKNSQLQTMEEVQEVQEMQEMQENHPKKRMKVVKKEKEKQLKKHLQVTLQILFPKLLQIQLTLENLK